MDADFGKRNVTSFALNEGGAVVFPPDSLRELAETSGGLRMALENGGIRIDILRQSPPAGEIVPFGDTGDSGGADR